MIKRIETSFIRTAAPLALLLALTGCMSELQSFVGTPAAVQQTATPAAVAPPPSVNISAPSSIFLAVKPSLVGTYFGWQMDIIANERNAGFKPGSTLPVGDEQGVRVDLWPDRYRVVVRSRGRVEMDRVIELGAGETKMINVDIGFVYDNATLVDDQELIRAAQAVTAWYVLPASKFYDPVEIPLQKDLTAHFDGPRTGDMPYGEGAATLYENGTLVGTINEASFENGRLKGEIQFTDGRETTTAELDENNSLPDGTETRLPDGRHFKGGYKGISPAKGILSYPDGTRWDGEVARFNPFNSGRVTLPDGRVLDDVPGIDLATYDGAYSCRRPGGAAETCYFAKGKPLANEAEYQAHLAQEKRDTEIAAEATRQAEIRRQAEAAREAEERRQAEAAAAPKIDGCTFVEGEFSTSSGLSKITLDGRGSGHLWQQTYGGGATYTMDIDFSYSGTRDSMSFTYRPAEYRDSSGKLMQTIPVPGGTASCSFDGRNLRIDDQVYSR